MTLCQLEFVREDGDGFHHRCPKCKAEIVSRYRDPSKRKQTCGAIDKGGPGSELLRLFAECGIKPKKGCECQKLRREMNKLGVDGCRAKRDDLLAKLRKNAAKYGLADWLTAGWSAIKSGVALRINPLDPLGSLLDSAIRRSSESAPWRATHSASRGRSPRPSPG